MESGSPPLLTARSGLQRRNTSPASFFWHAIGYFPLPERPFGFSPRLPAWPGVGITGAKSKRIDDDPVYKLRRQRRFASLRSALFSVARFFSGSPIGKGSRHCNHTLSIILLFFLFTKLIPTDKTRLSKKYHPTVSRLLRLSLACAERSCVARGSSSLKSASTKSLATKDLKSAGDSPTPM